MMAFGKYPQKVGGLEKDFYKQFSFGKYSLKKSTAFVPKVLEKYYFKHNFRSNDSFEIFF